MNIVALLVVLVAVAPVEAPAPVEPPAPAVVTAAEVEPPNNTGPLVSVGTGGAVCAGCTVGAAGLSTAAAAAAMFAFMSCGLPATIPLAACGAATPALFAGLVGPAAVMGGGWAAADDTAPPGPMLFAAAMPGLALGVLAPTGAAVALMGAMAATRPWWTSALPNLVVPYLFSGLLLGTMAFLAAVVFAPLVSWAGLVNVTMQHKTKVSLQPDVLPPSRGAERSDRPVKKAMALSF